MVLNAFGGRLYETTTLPFVLFEWLFDHGLRDETKRCSWGPLFGLMLAEIT